MIDQGAQFSPPSPYGEGRGPTTSGGGLKEDPRTRLFRGLVDQLSHPSEIVTLARAKALNRGDREAASEALDKIEGRLRTARAAWLADPGHRDRFLTLMAERWEAQGSPRSVSARVATLFLRSPERSGEEAPNSERTPFLVLRIYSPRGMEQEMLVSAAWAAWNLPQADPSLRQRTVSSDLIMKWAARGFLVQGHGRPPNVVNSIGFRRFTDQEANYFCSKLDSEFKSQRKALQKARRALGTLQKDEQGIALASPPITLHAVSRRAIKLSEAGLTPVFIRNRDGGVLSIGGDPIRLIGLNGESLMLQGVAPTARSGSPMRVEIRPAAAGADDMSLRTLGLLTSLDFFTARGVPLLGAAESAARRIFTRALRGAVLVSEPRKEFGLDAPSALTPEALHATIQLPLPAHWAQQYLELLCPLHISVVRAEQGPREVLYGFERFSVLTNDDLDAPSFIFSRPTTSSAASSPTTIARLKDEPSTLRFLHGGLTEPERLSFMEAVRGYRGASPARK